MSTSRDETPLAAPTAAKLKSNIWTRDSSLGSFFKPKVVAVIGASEKPGGVGPRSWRTWGLSAAPSTR